MRTVSFILPVKNEEFHIKACLEAIGIQSSPEVRTEVIVVDNGSSDGTCEIAAALGAKVVIEPESRVSGLRNLGAGAATGDVFCFIDADVRIEPGFMAQGLSVLATEGVGIATGPIGIRPKPSWVEQGWAMNRPEAVDGARLVEWSSSMNMLVTREAFESAGGFDPDLVAGEDVEFCRRIRKAGYSIVFDNAVRVIHLGEARTLRHLFRKELWRGTGAIRILARGGGSLRGWLLLGQLVFLLGALLTALLGLLLGRPLMVFVGLVAFFLVPFARAVLISKKKKSLGAIPGLTLIWGTYYLARLWALVKDTIGSLRR